MSDQVTGSPIAFQSSQTRRRGWWRARRCWSPFQLLQCCFTVAYGKFGLTPPFSDGRRAPAGEQQLETVGEQRGRLRGLLAVVVNGAAPVVSSVSLIRRCLLVSRPSSAGEPP
jgi:hypothetical protein